MVGCRWKERNNVTFKTISEESNSVTPEWLMRGRKYHYLLFVYLRKVIYPLHVFMYIYNEKYNYTITTNR